MGEIHSGRQHASSRLLDACGLVALGGAAASLSAAHYTENHMAMGVFMGLFIALILGSILLFGWLRFRLMVPVGRLEGQSHPPPVRQRSLASRYDSPVRLVQEDVFESLRKHEHASNAASG